MDRPGIENRPGIEQAASIGDRPAITGRESLSGSVSQDVLQPPPFAAPSDFGQFAANTGADLSNLKQGLFTVGSFAKERLYEGVPFPRFTPQGDFIPPQSIVRFEDVPGAAMLAGAVVKSYYDDYLEPVFKQGSLKPIGDRFLQKPISTSLDLLPAVQPTKFLAGKAATGLGKAGEAAAKTAVGQRAVEAAGKFGDWVGQRAAPYVNPVKDAFELHSKIRDTVQTFNRRFIDEANGTLEKVKDAFDKVPKDLQDDLIAAGEMRDLDKFRKLQGIAEVEDFWKAVNDADGFLSGALIAGKAMTPEEKLAAQYGPFARAKTGMTEAELWTPRGQRILQAVKQELDAMGRIPTYFGIITLKQVRSALRIRGSLFGGKISKGAAQGKFEQVLKPEILPELESKLKNLDAQIEQVLKQPGQSLDELKALRTQRDSLLREMNKIEKGQPGFLRKRQVGDRVADKHSSNAYDVFASRYLQGLQYLYIRDFFQKLFSDVRFHGTSTKIPGYAEFKVDDFFQKLGQSHGIDSKQISDFLRSQGVPETVQMPNAAARKLTSLLGDLMDTGDRYKLGGGAQLTADYLAKGLMPFANIQKSLQLGFNLGWAVYQQFQNASIYAYAAFQGPRDIVASIMAIPLAFDKELAKALPKWWTSTDFAEAAPAAGQLEGFAKIKAFPHAVMNGVFGIATKGDNFHRRLMGAYESLRQIDKLPPAQRSLMNQAFSLQAARENIIRLVHDEGKAAEVGKEIEKWFGKYDELSRQERRHLRAVITYVDWWFHSFSILGAVPERPWKASLMSKLMAEAPLRLQDPSVQTEFELRRGAVPVRDRDGKLAKGPNGKPMMMFGTALDLPLTTPLELIGQGVDATATQSTERNGLPVMNPLLPLILEASGMNAHTGTLFQAPDLIRTRGKSYIGEGPDKGKQVVKQKPDALHLLLRNFASSQEGQLREAIAFPNKPSDMTSILNPLNPRPKQSYSSGPVRNFDMASLILYNFLRLKPLEQGITKTDERRIKRYEKNTFRRALRKQKGKLETQPSFIRDLLVPGQQ